MGGVGTSLAFRILATDDGASKVMTTLGGHAGNLEGRLSLLSKGTHKFGEVTRDAFKLAAGAVIGAGLVEGLKDLYTEARGAELISKQTAAAIKSTGGAAHITADQVSELAGAISDKTAVDDDAIQSGANLLLTFTNVRNEAGKGNDIFNQATSAIVDMTAAMNGGVVSQEGLKSQSILVGKALNDPIKGLTALSKVGVTFTAQQKDQIRALVESGDTLDAQKIILHELGKEFGGSAEAAATGAKRLGVAVGNIKEALGASLVKAVDSASESVAGKLPAAMAAGGKAFDLIADPVGRIAHDFLTILVPLFSDAIHAVIPLAAVVGGSLVIGLRALATVLDFLADNTSVFVPLAEGALAFAAASKAVSLAQAAYVGIIGALETVQLKAMYAADGVRSLASAEDKAKVAAFGMNLILGALAVGVGAVMSKHMQAKQAQDDYNQSVMSFSATLRENSGLINDNVRAARAQELEQKGLLDLAQKIGINLHTYTDATLGSAAAQETYRQKLIAAHDAGQLTYDQFQNLILGTQKYTNVTSDAGVSNTRLGEATEKTAGATRNLSAEQKQAAALIAATKKQSDELWDSLNKLANTDLSAMQAQIAFRGALAEVDGSMKGLTGRTKEQTRALSLDTDAGREARSQLIQHVQAALADGEAQKKRGKSTADATKTVQSDIAELRKHYLQLGYNEDAVDLVISSLRELGKQHPKPTAKVDTSQALKAIDLLNRKLTTLDGRSVTTYAYNLQQDIAVAAGGGKKGHAGGGIAERGWSWKGEFGPELSYTPDPTAIFTAEQSRQMVASFKGGSGGGGLTITGPITVVLKGASGREAAQEFAAELKKMNRNGFSVSV